MLRIVAGKYGGRFIKAPEGALTRPTSQVAREALFSMLASRIQRALFIDLFAGSGAIGIEALSRGAEKVIFVDSNSECIALIHENLRSVGASAKDTLVLNVDLALKQSIKSLREGIKRLGEVAADIVFADPPYSFEGVCGLPLMVSESPLCSTDALIIIEHSKKTVLPQKAGLYALNRTKHYNDTSISFYECYLDGDMQI